MYYPQLVFSGGGTRCFWQGGFMHVVRDHLETEPDRIAGVSGGALSAAGYIARRGRDVLAEMSRRFAEQDDNVALDEIDDDADGLTPHQRIYREVVEAVLDAPAQARIADGPSFQILIARPSEWVPERIAGVLSAMLYEGELHLVSRPHPEWTRKIGLAAELTDARRAAAEGRLADLVWAAATIPPLFAPPEWEGRPALDGGMADQAPMPDPDSGKTLILLKREFSDIPEVAGRDYVTPSGDTPADKIDFTDPGKIDGTWQMGVADGRRFVEQRNVNHI